MSIFNKFHTWLVSVIDVDNDPIPSSEEIIEFYESYNGLIIDVDD